MLFAQELQGESGSRAGHSTQRVGAEQTPQGLVTRLDVVLHSTHAAHPGLQATKLAT